MRKTVYQVGDQVVPVDLPRALVCRVASTDEVPLRDGESAQILTLQPLGGPWEQGTTLVRLDSAVRPVGGRHTTRAGARRGGSSLAAASC
ncbi:MAG: hypothetical protein ACREQL_14310 [Candidatus Binatia bacterium]